MHTPDTVRRFSSNSAPVVGPYARLETELNVTKPTLIDWSRKHQFEIQNLHAIELEALRAKWLASTSEHVDAVGEQLRRVEAELATRNLTKLTTPQLRERCPKPPPSPDRAEPPARSSSKRSSKRR